MGLCGSTESRGKFNDKYDEDGAMISNHRQEQGVLFTQKLLTVSTRIPMEVQVAHFTPSSFPMIPVVNKKNCGLCENSWNRIVTSDVSDEYGSNVSGMTVFYNEFYERLAQLDSNGRFEAVLSRHSSGLNKIAAKGAILVRIIKFVLKIDGDTKQNQMMLFMLGKSHAQKHIRPWQYSVFVQTLLITISARLGTGATNDVMEAWVNLFAFVMQSMLPPAIKGQVVETELNINTSSEFADGRVAQEVAELEEVHEVRRKMKGDKQVSNSSGSQSDAVVHTRQEQAELKKKLAESRKALKKRGPGTGGGANNMSHDGHEDEEETSL